MSDETEKDYLADRGMDKAPDAGWIRRQIIFSALGDAMEVCARPDFGKPKPARAYFKDGRMQEFETSSLFMQWVRELKRVGNRDALPEYAEKLWQDRGWETFWTKKDGAV